MDNVYGVVFNDGGKVYYFKSAFSCPINVTVIVETEKGEQFGKVVTEVTELEKVKKIDSFKDIIRIATKQDYSRHLTNLKDSDKALKKCRELCEELDLDMKVINASFTFDRSQLLFNFLADERIDFRELARKLAGIYKTRIELRQIGARDKAREISGIGVCGHKLCCSNFLTSIDAVSINMAKNQNLALNPTKINGQCNRLLCCLAYEDDMYTACRKNLPAIGNKVKYGKEYAEVVDLDVLNNKYTILIDEERIVVDNNENSKK
jgi:cell fate regulator YaaT (PSP1 superfamily)